MEQNDLPNLKRTRLHRSVAEIRQLLRSQRRSKLTIKSWCAANGIRENNFYRWQKKYGNKPIKSQQPLKVASGKGFTRLAITPVGVTTTAPSLFAEIGHLRIYQEVPATYLKTLLS
jgi:hypothetical protein